MSEFKYQWQVGDKATNPKSHENERSAKCLIVKKGTSENASFMLKSSTGIWGSYKHGVFFAGNNSLVPRGKKTKARYAAAKAKWESEQVEINVGDWVVCESGNYDVAKVGSIYKVSSIEDNMMYLYETGLSYHRLNFRKATPEEIKAHKLSLKPSVEQLRIERDAAADALAGYCCGVYPKGENIHLEKFKEAKAAHLQAVGGEG